MSHCLRRNERINVPRVKSDLEAELGNVRSGSAFRMLDIRPLANEGRKTFTIATLKVTVTSTRFPQRVLSAIAFNPRCHASLEGMSCIT